MPHLYIIIIIGEDPVCSTVKENKAFLLSQSDFNNTFDKTFNFMIKSLLKCESNINCKKIHESSEIQILIEN